MELDLNNKLILFYGSRRLFNSVIRLLDQKNIRVLSCSRSSELLTSIRNNRPDLLVYICGINDELNIRNISLAAQLMPELKIIAAAFNNWDERLTAYENAGAFRTLILPMETERIAFLLMNHLRFNKESQIPDIADFLYMQGFTTRTMGFFPLCRMVEVCCSYPYCLRHPTQTRLTYNIANEFDYKPVNLDRLIRYIAVSEDKKRTLSRMTGGRIWWRPGNHAFLAIICDKYYTYRNRLPHKLPRNTKTLPPEVIQEIRLKKKKRRWVYVGKPKAD